nr:uncharacterized protein LOC133617277 isoform X2 [Nerophis lumbriciformis]
MLYILRLLLARMATSGQRRKAEPSGRHLHHLIKKYRIETTMSALNSDTREDDPVHRRMKKTPLSAINAPVADEKTCLLKPAQPAIRGQNVATYPVHSVPPFRATSCVSRIPSASLAASWTSTSRPDTDF